MNSGGYGKSTGRPQGQQQVSITVPDFNDAEALGKKAEDLSRTLADHTGLTTHQLRRFYNEVKNIERILDASQDKVLAWKTAFPRIKLLKAKAVYNASRKQNRLPSQFCDFISKCVERIPAEKENGMKAFDSFCQLFEAVVGYSSAYTRD